MTDFQENNFTMYKVVKTGITPFLPEIDAVPALSSARLRFYEIIDLIDKAIQIQSTNVKGYTESKKIRRQKMCDAAFETGQIISAYALANNNTDMDKMVNLPLSYYNRLRDEEVANNCRTIYQIAVNNLGELVNFGLNQAHIDNLNEYINKYAENSQINKVSWQQKNSQTSVINLLIKEGNSILNNSFDKMMLLFRTTKPTLYAAYTAARNSMPTRHACKSNGEITDEEAGILTGTVTDKADGMPIMGATVNLKGTTFTTETDDDGVYLFDTLPADTYTTEVVILDYVTATLPDQKVEAGDETIADFEMVKTI